MALIDKLAAIADGFRASRGTTDKLSLEQMAVLAAEPIGGGGGLPDGISALASGIIAPTSNITADYTVTHNLGKVPDFAILMLLNDAATTALKSTQLFQLLSHKPFMSGSTLNYTRGLGVYQSSSGAASNTIITAMDSSYANETTVKFRALSNQPLKAGYRYLWICGVLD